MVGIRLGLSLILGLCLSLTPVDLSAYQTKTPKDLLQYIEDAKRLGLKEEQIRQNAVAAGWSKEMVSDALAIARYMEENGASGNASGQRKPVVEPSGYRIGTGDVLQILVWKEPDVSVPNVVVRTDGKITVPLVKEIEVAGLTPQELEKILIEKLSKFIRGVDVTVVPKEIVSQKVFILGAVRKEGPVPIQSAMTVLQAINAAGGLTDYAKKKKIYILRNENGKQQRLPFDYQAVIRGERPEQNILVRPEDTIVVP
jgi:polysaccharide export outer membrane protein